MGCRAGIIYQPTLSEFIDVEYAYSRMNVFVTTHEFLILSKETKTDVVAFLIAMRRNKETSQTEGFVAEEIINEELQKIISTIQS